jgi:hypothetical protein
MSYSVRRHEAAVAEALAGKENLENMRFCETNPNFTGAILDATAYAYGISEAERRLSIRVRFPGIGDSSRSHEGSTRYNQGEHGDRAPWLHEEP